MTIRPLTAADRPLLREATLANPNWNGGSSTLDNVDKTPEISHYFANFPSSRDFGLAHQDDDAVHAVAWLVFFSAEAPGYGFINEGTPELSITTFDGHRGQGLGSTLLGELIRQARSRGLTGISLSVEDGNNARHLYARAGFRVAGRNGNSDTMFFSLLPDTRSGY